VPGWGLDAGNVSLPDPTLAPDWRRPEYTRGPFRPFREAFPARRGPHPRPGQPGAAGSAASIGQHVAPFAWGPMRMCPRDCQVARRTAPRSRCATWAYRSSPRTSVRLGRETSSWLCAVPASVESTPPPTADVTRETFALEVIPKLLAKSHSVASGNGCSHGGAPPSPTFTTGGIGLIPVELLHVEHLRPGI
jgi:hypothetical protein